MYLWVNPHYPDLVARELAEFDGLRDVFVGLKVHPDSHEVPLTDERYRRALEFAEERGLDGHSHTYGRSKFNGPEQVRRTLERYTSIRFLMGHSLKSNWHEAAAVARDHPHAYLESTGVLGQWGAVDILCEEAGSDRMLFGTGPAYLRKLSRDRTSSVRGHNRQGHPQHLPPERGEAPPGGA